MVPHHRAVRRDLPSILHCTEVRSGSRILVLLATMAMALLACDSGGPFDPSLPGGDIGRFLQEEPLPDIRDYREVFADPSRDVLFFEVGYGEAQDCPSGCFYFQAVSLRLGDRIGWVWIDGGYTVPDPDALTVFDFQSTDGALFDEPVLLGLRAASRDVYSRFRFYAAGHPGTPETGLVALAHTLELDPWPTVGWALLENPTVRASRPVLQVLADLPDEPGLTSIREEAQELLDQIPSEPS